MARRRGPLVTDLRSIEERPRQPGPFCAHARIHHALNEPSDGGPRKWLSARHGREDLHLGARPAKPQREIAVSKISKTEAQMKRGKAFATTRLATGTSRPRSVENPSRPSIGILRLQTRAWLYESGLWKIKSLASVCDVWACPSLSVEKTSGRPPRSWAVTRQRDFRNTPASLPEADHCERRDQHHGHDDAAASRWREVPKKQNPSRRRQPTGFVAARSKDGETRSLGGPIEEPR
jgi:hypothetical protein